jgi:phosphoglycerol transferase MdoB-like AlkP superfamily enzyme
VAADVFAQTSRGTRSDPTASTDAPLPRRADRRRAETVRPDLFLPALIVLAVAKAALSRYLGLGATDAAGPLFEIAAIAVLLGLADMLRRKRSYAVDLIAYSALSLVMLANVMYASFFGQIFSPQLLSVIGQAGEVADSITSSLRPIYILYVIDIPLLSVWAALTWNERESQPERDRRWVMAAVAFSAVVLAMQIVLVLSLPADTDGRAVARARGFGAYQLASVVRLALPDAVTSQVTALANEKDLTPAQAAQLRIDRVRGGSGGTRMGGVLPGEYRGKNVIVIQVETLQSLVIDARYAGREITPNLNKLAAESWYFPNTFSQTSAGNTVDAEFTVNTSLLAPTDGASSIKYSDYELTGLPRLMRSNGYDAITLHQNDVRFWNRVGLYPALGFRRYWDKSYFRNRDKIWHASDQVLFEDGMKVLRSEAASDAPFYSLFITESSHAPFKGIPLARRPLRLKPEDEQTLSGRYLGSMSYTDMAIGEFIRDLKRSGLWDKSIVVIYGDHSALLDSGPKLDDSRVAKELLGRDYSELDRQRIPLIIHLPGQTKSYSSTKPVGQIDIMPTIADLLGLNLSATPHIGRSVFVNSHSLIPTRSYLPGGSFVNDRVLFMPGLGFDDGRALGVASAKEVAPTERDRADYAAVRQLGILSEAWVKSRPKRSGANGSKGAIIPH